MITTELFLTAPCLVGRLPGMPAALPLVVVQTVGGNLRDKGIITGASLAARVLMALASPMLTMPMVGPSPARIGGLR